MPRLQQHRFGARLAQAGVQPWRERPGFQPDAGHRQAEPAEEPDQRLGRARHHWAYGPIPRRDVSKADRASRTILSVASTTHTLLCSRPYVRR